MSRWACVCWLLKPLTLKWDATNCFKIAFWSLTLPILLQMSPTEEDEEFWSRLRSIPSDRCADAADNTEEEMNSSEQTVNCQTPEATETPTEEISSQHIQETINNPSTTLPRVASSEGPATSNAGDNGSSEGGEDHHRQEEGDEPSSPSSSSSVPREKILERINSKKEAKSYQLGKQLSFKWTTGAGPRIVCVRDYPSELQLRALEQVHLSPRSAAAAAGGRPSSRFASPQRSSSPMARGCSEPLTPREAFRSHLQQGVLIRWTDHRWMGSGKLWWYNSPVLCLEQGDDTNCA